MQVLDPPSGRQKVVRCIFAGDAAFDRPSTRRDFLLLERKLFSRRDPQLPLDEIDSRDELGHGVFHLQPSVHLEKIELAVPVEQKLAGPRVHVAGSASRTHRSLPHLLSQRRSDRDARRFLDHFLMPPLHRAFALAQ